MEAQRELDLPSVSVVALYAIGAGIVGALLAAIPGFIDYLSIDEAEMKRIATTHLLVGLGSVVIFGLSLWLRFRLEEGSKVPLLLSSSFVCFVRNTGRLRSNLFSTFTWMSSRSASPRAMGAPVSCLLRGGGSLDRNSRLM